MPLKDRLLKFWDPDRSLTAMLVLLTLNILVLAPAAGLGEVVTPLTHLSLALLFVAGVFTMKRGAVRVATLGVVAVAVGIRIAAVLVGDILWVHVAAAVSSSAAFALIIYVVALMVYREGPVTGHRIRGAVALYLLIAAFFATAYVTVELIYPGAFHFAATTALTASELRDSLTYFSCVTLTTVGYGDVTAVHPFARTLVMFEALIGQLYPAILLARLVTLYEETKRPGKMGGSGKNSR